MAKHRTEPCKSYLSEGNPCEKKKIAEHGGKCQRCRQYEPRVHIKHKNEKKEKLRKIGKKESLKEAKSII